MAIAVALKEVIFQPMHGGPDALLVLCPHADELAAGAFRYPNLWAFHEVLAPIARLYRSDSREHGSHVLDTQPAVVSMVAKTADHPGPISEIDSDEKVFPMFVSHQVESMKIAMPGQSGPKAPK